MENLKQQYSFHFGANEDIIKTTVHEKIDTLLEGKNIVKEIYIKNKIYNIVVK